MNIATLVGAVLYFTIGCILSDWLNTEDKYEVSMFIFLFWPLMIIFLGMIIVMGLAAIVATLLSKLFELLCGRHNGGDSNGTV